MTGALVAGLVAGYGVAMPVGAVATYLVGLAAREGLGIAVAAALGVATTDGVYALVAVVGGAGARRLVRPVATPLTYVAAGVLVALAIRTVRAAARRYRERVEPSDEGPTGTRPARAYLRLVAVTALNPSTIGYFAALVMGRQAAHTGAAPFVAGAFLASASWQLLLAVGGVALGRLVTDARGRLGIALGSGAIMLALAVALVAP
jgi:arginine exporter protein ArgO